MRVMPSLATMTNPEPDPEIDIPQMIKERLASIDDKLDELVAERTRISNEIRELRKERIPLQRLARAAEPKPSRSTAPASLRGVADPPTDSSPSPAA